MNNIKLNTKIRRFFDRLGGGGVKALRVKDNTGFGSNGGDSTDVEELKKRLGRYEMSLDLSAYKIPEFGENIDVEDVWSETLSQYQLEYGEGWWPINVYATDSNGFSELYYGDDGFYADSGKEFTLNRPEVKWSNYCFADLSKYQKPTSLDTSVLITDAPVIPQDIQIGTPVLVIDSEGHKYYEVRETDAGKYLYNREEGLKITPNTDGTYTWSAELS